MYNYMRAFLQIKLLGTGKSFSDQDLTNEANKMYVYMKLYGKGFWNILYNDKRTAILEELYKNMEINKKIADFRAKLSKYPSENVII